MGIVLVCGDAHVIKFLHQRKDASLSLPKNSLNGLKPLLEVRGLFPKRVTVLAPLAQKPLLKKTENFPPLSIAHTQLKRVVNFCSTRPFCWGISGVVYSNLIPIPYLSQDPSKSTFSLALMQYAYQTLILVLKFLIRLSITFFNLDFLFKK